MANALSAIKANSDPDREAVAVPVDVQRIAAAAKKTKAQLPAYAFELPVALASNPDVLEELLTSLLELSSTSIAEPNAREGLRRRLTETGVPPGQHDFWNRNLALMRWLLEP